MVRSIERVNSVQINTGNTSVVVVGTEVARRANLKQHLHFGKQRHGKRPSSAAPASSESTCWGPGYPFAGCMAGRGAGQGDMARLSLRDRSDRDVRAGRLSPSVVATQTLRPGTTNLPAPIWAALVLSRAMSL